VAHTLAYTSTKNNVIGVVAEKQGVPVTCTVNFQLFRYRLSSFQVTYASMPDLC